MSKLLTQLRAQRSGKVEVLPGKYLLVRRPLEATDMPRFRGRIDVDLVLEHVTGWENITEADLLGASVGAGSPAEFTPELAAEVLGDRSEWVRLACDWLVDAIKAHLAKREAAEKN